MSDTGIVKIHNKEYKTVALRINEFREQYPAYAIETEVLCAGELVSVKATIKSDDGRVLSTGLAEENRAFGNINKTSALENAETSAVGRALAFFGLGGTEIASADEVAGAISQQNVQEAVEYLMRHNVALRNNIESVTQIKTAISVGDISTAAEAWREISTEDQHALWVAPTKGGVFSTQERETMKSTEWREA